MSGFEPELKITTKQTMEKSASSTNPGVKLPVACRTAPSTSGGKNPPSPPAAPTSPGAAPTDCGKYSGTSSCHFSTSLLERLTDAVSYAA